MTARKAMFTLVAVVALGIPRFAFAQLPSVETPGAKSGADEAAVCAADFGAGQKPVSPWQVGQALSRYGRRLDDKTVVVDHLIPVKLGGTHEPDNLWPQPAKGEWDATKKDELEDKLHSMVCSKAITLKIAQETIKKDWVKAYKQYVHAAN
jgi:hypothetical protein